MDKIVYYELDVVKCNHPSANGMYGTIVHVLGESNGEWFYILEINEPVHMLIDVSENDLEEVE